MGMASGLDGSVGASRFLKKADIDRRIEAVIREVAEAETPAAGEIRWINPRDLVERMRPFLVHN
jgi:hypothetical protein